MEINGLPISGSNFYHNSEIIHAVKRKSITALLHKPYSIEGSFNYTHATSSLFYYINVPAIKNCGKHAHLAFKKIVWS